MWKCARLLGRDPVAAIVLVGLNPIVLVWGLGGDHNDFLMVFCIVLGFYLLLRVRGAVAWPAIQQTANRSPSTGEPPAASRRVAPRLGGGWPLAPLEIGAGVAFVTAAAIKASGAVLIPVVLAALLRAPRRRRAGRCSGWRRPAVLVAAASLIAFGLHVPDLSTQSRLVTSVSVPNLLGLALGTRRRDGNAAHAAERRARCSWWCAAACSPGGGGTRSRPPAGRRSRCSLTLGWVLPWYVLWVLPLAALSSSRRLRTTALVLGVYLIIAWAPASGLLWNTIGFHPEKTSLGRLHQRYVKELLN